MLNTDLIDRFSNSEHTQVIQNSIDRVILVVTKVGSRGPVTLYSNYWVVKRINGSQLFFSYSAAIKDFALG